MWVLLIPNKCVNQWAKTKLKVDGVNRRILCCEGTGHVAADFIENEQHRFNQINTSNLLECYTHPRVSNGFYHYVIHGYTNTLFRLGYESGHVTFMNKNRYGVPFEKVITQNKKIWFYHHPSPLPLLPEINLILSMEHPSPPLKIPEKNPPMICSKLNFNLSVGKDTNENLDLYLPLKITRKVKKEIEEIGKKLKATKIVSFLEKTDVNHSRYRVRIFF